MMFLGNVFSYTGGITRSQVSEIGYAGLPYQGLWNPGVRCQLRASQHAHIIYIGEYKTK